MKVAGIVWIQEISNVKISSELQGNLDTFWALCGDSAVKNVILATTKWDDVDEEVGSKNEQKLVSTVWKDMIKHGSISMHCSGCCCAAWCLPATNGSSTTRPAWTRTFANCPATYHESCT